MAKVSSSPNNPHFSDWEHEFNDEARNSFDVIVPTVLENTPAYFEAVSARDVLFEELGRLGVGHGGVQGHKLPTPEGHLAVLISRSGFRKASRPSAGNMRVTVNEVENTTDLHHRTRFRNMDYFIAPNTLKLLKYESVFLIDPGQPDAAPPCSPPIVAVRNGDIRRSNVQAYQPPVRKLYNRHPIIGMQLDLFHDEITNLVGSYFKNLSDVTLEAVEQFGE